MNSGYRLYISITFPPFKICLIRTRQLKSMLDSQNLATDMFVVKNVLASKMIKDLFSPCNPAYNLKSKIEFVSDHMKIVHFST